MANKPAPQNGSISEELRELLLAIREGNIVQNRAIERLLGLKPSTPPKERK